MPAVQSNKTTQNVADNLDAQRGALASRLARLKNVEGTQQGDILIDRLNDQVNKVAMVLGEIDAFLGP